MKMPYNDFMTIGQQKVLQDVTNYYSYSINSQKMSTYKQRMKAYLNYRDGNVIDALLKEDLDKISAKYYHINIVEPEISNLIAIQIASRKNITFKANSSFVRHQEIANNFKNYLYVFQQQNDYQNQATAKFCDAITTGTGAAKIEYNEKTGKIKYEFFDCAELILDPDDKTLRQDNSDFIGRQYYLSANSAKLQYPKLSGYIDSIVDTNTTASTEYNFLDTIDGAPWVCGRTLKIVEIYYKKLDKCYKAITRFSPDEMDVDTDYVDSYFYTFNKELATEYKKRGTDIEEIECTRIYKAVFNDCVLFESGPIPAQTPNQKYFPILPLIVKKDSNSIPYGLVKNLMSINDMVSYVWSQHLHALNQKTVLATGTNIDIAKYKDVIIEQIRSKYGFIALNAADIQLLTNDKSLPFMERALQRLDIDKQQITQLYDEQKGKQTRAQSGITVETLGANSRQMQNPYGVVYDYMLWSEGQLLIDTIKGIKNLNLEFYYLNNQEMSFGRINNEAALLDFQIFQDIGPAFISSNEELSDKLMGIIKSGAAPLVFSNEFFAEKIAGLDQKDSAKAIEAFRNLTNPQPEPQQINNNDGENV